MWCGVLVRQILGEIFRYTGLILSSLLVLGIPGMVFKEQMSRHIPLANVVSLVPYLIPDCLRLALPLSLMLATIFVFGRMAGDNEITAVKSLGISPLKLIGSLLGISLVLSLFCVWLNDVAVTWTAKGICNVIQNSAEDIVYNRLSNEGEIRSDKLHIKVQDVHGSTLVEPEIIFWSNSDKGNVTVIAKEAQLFSDIEAGELQAELTDGTIRSELGVIAFRNKQCYRFPITSLLRLCDNNHPAYMSLKQLRVRCAELSKLIQEKEQRLAAGSAMIFLSGDFEQINDDNWRINHNDLEGNRRLLSKMQVEPFRRWSMGFACLCFVIVGAPVAIWSRQTNVITCIFICAGPILILFAACFSIGLNLAKHSHVPPSGVCIGNVILLVLGLFLMWNATRN